MTDVGRVTDNSDTASSVAINIKREARSWRVMTICSHADDGVVAFSITTNMLIVHVGPFIQLDEVCGPHIVEEFLPFRYSMAAQPIIE